MIAAGNMRYIAKFQRRVINKSAAGKAIETWVDEFQTRCEVDQSQVDAITDDDANLEFSALKIKIRETPKAKLITASQHRILIDGIYYKIDVIDKFKIKNNIIFNLSNYD
jgi:head-tail adaptor